MPKNADLNMNNGERLLTCVVEWEAWEGALEASDLVLLPSGEAAH